LTIDDLTSEITVSMETSSRKKLGKIGILTKENAPDWFQQMESHLRGERQWKVIQDVETERQREAAEAAAKTPEKAALPAEAGTDSTGQATPEGTPEPEVSQALEKLSENEDWDAKNWKAISTITALVKSLDRHTVRKCKYAGDIWIYLTGFYKQSDRTAQMLALKRLITWKMNISHTVKEAGQEISYIADRVHQVEGELQSPRLIKVLFLNGLPKEYEGSRQLLEFHAKNLDQMIESLSAAEARMKGEKENQYGMDIATESARRTRAEWLKTAKCYNCDEVGHVARNCKKPKKDRKNDEKADENDNKKTNEKTDERKPTD
jgi:gag-polypeptide of LTR copia-type/Zinc knuckle